jgi:hypothetical protein
MYRGVNYLPDNFYLMPRFAHTTLTREELKQTLLYTEGWITACGCIWDIVSKPVGAGVYYVELKEHGAKQ